MTTPARTALSAAAAIVAAAVVGLTASLVRPGLNELLLVFIGALLVVPLIRRWRAGRFDVFEPLTIFAAIYGLLFFVRPLAMIMTGEFQVRGFDVEAAMPGLLLVALIGLLAFHAGYALPWGERLAQRAPRPPKRLNPKVMLGYAVLLTAAAVALLMLFIWQSGGQAAARELLRGRSAVNAQFFASSNQYVSQGIYLLIPAALILFATRVRRNHRALLVFALAAAVAVVLVSFPLGTRRWLLVLAGSLFALTYLRRETRPRFAQLVLVAAVLLIGVTFVRDARIASYRESVGLVGIFTQSVADVETTARRVALGADSEPAAAFAIEMTAVPSALDHRYGLGAVPDLVFSPIPHNLWPGKPRTAMDELRVHLWNEPCSGAPEALCLDFTLLGDFYLDFGLPGVAGGMFVIGLALRALYSYFLAHRHNVAVQLVFAAIIPYIVIYMRAGLVPVTGWMAIVVAPVLLAVLLAGRWQGRDASSEGDAVARPRVRDRALTWAQGGTS